MIKFFNSIETSSPHIKMIENILTNLPVFLFLFVKISAEWVIYFFHLLQINNLFDVKLGISLSESFGIQDTYVFSTELSFT